MRNVHSDQRLDMLIFAAHPDDAEIGMGGTIRRHVEAGYRVGICDLTLAEMSSNGDVQTRQAEAKNAADILGLTVRTNLKLPDRGLRISQEQIDLLVLEIRKYCPRIVFAPYWEDRHPDHVMCSKMVQEAVFNAKLRRYMPDVAPCQVEDLYFYFIHDLAEADFLVDISDVFQHKMEALKAYESQFEQDPAGRNTVPTPLNQGYLERVAARDRLLGHRRLVAYAEGFKTLVPRLVDLL